MERARATATFENRSRRSTARTPVARVQSSNRRRSRKRSLIFTNAIGECSYGRLRLIHAAHIVKNVDEQHDEASARAGIEAGVSGASGWGPFEEVANRHSDCAGNEEISDGLLEARWWMNSMPLCLRCRSGSRSDIFGSAFGFHIATVMERKPAGLRALKEVESEMPTFYRRRKSAKSDRRLSLTRYGRKRRSRRGKRRSEFGTEDRGSSASVLRAEQAAGGPAGFVQVCVRGSGARAVRIDEGMVRLDGGRFLMGTESQRGVSRDGEGPVREVTVDGFYMDARPVSNGAVSSSSSRDRVQDGIGALRHGHSFFTRISPKRWWMHGRSEWSGGAKFRGRLAASGGSGFLYRRTCELPGCSCHLE